MNKLVINHLDKIFVTSDASVMMTELEVQHPAAKLLVMAAKSQETEIGDGTNLVRTTRVLNAAPRVWLSQARFAEPTASCWLKAWCPVGDHAGRRAAGQGDAPAARGPHHHRSG